MRYWKGREDGDEREGGRKEREREKKMKGK